MARCVCVQACVCAQRGGWQPLKMLTKRIQGEKKKQILCLLLLLQIPSCIIAYLHLCRLQRCIRVHASFSEANPPSYPVMWLTIVAAALTSLRCCLRRPGIPPRATVFLLRSAFWRLNSPRQQPPLFPPSLLYVFHLQCLFPPTVGLHLLAVEERSLFFFLFLRSLQRPPRSSLGFSAAFVLSSLSSCEAVTLLL